jgi:hypothetical protein
VAAHFERGCCIAACVSRQQAVLHAVQLCDGQSVTLLLWVALQTAHNLNGSGLLPWSGDVKQTFEQQYAALLKAQVITNSGIAYVGSVVSV